MTHLVIWLISMFFALHADDVQASDAAHDAGVSVEIMQIPEGTRVLPGVAKPRRAVTLGASFDSQVLEVLVEEGQRVSKGQPIARLDDRVARASLELAKQEANQIARVERALLRVSHTQHVLERTQMVHERGASNSEEIINAQSEADMARAEFAEATELIAAAMLRQRQAEAQVERHLIRAPFDGVVLRVPMEEGAIVRSGDAIAELADIDALSVDLFLPATVATGLASGDHYALHFHAPTDHVLWGAVRYIEPRIEPTSGTVRVSFDLPVPSGVTLAGTLITPATREPSDAEIALMRPAVHDEAYASQNDDG